MAAAVTTTLNKAPTVLLPSLIVNYIVKAPDMSVGGENVKTFPEELKVVQVGLTILIMVTV